MKRHMTVWTTGILLCAVVPAGCDRMGDTVSDAFAQGETPEAGDRLKQQLGDIPTELDTTAATRLSAAFRAASARALPAVVQIRTVALTDAPAAGFFPGMRQESGPQRTQGTGSGFVFDPRGYILTNNHVVRNALSVQVSMLDGNEYQAEVIGTDISTDIAVIKIDPDKIGVWGNSAGGHLVSLLGTSGDISDLEGENGSSGYSRSPLVYAAAGAADRPVADSGP